MSMQLWKLVGFGAAFCTTVAFVPQAVKAIRTRDTSSLSLGMYVIFTTGVFLWLTYGLLLRDAALVLANAITLVLSVVILVLKIRNDLVLGSRCKKTTAGSPGGLECLDFKRLFFQKRPKGRF